MGWLPSAWIVDGVQVGAVVQEVKATLDRSDLLRALSRVRGAVQIRI